MYTGQQAHIPLGQLGLFTDVPSGEVPRGALIKASNVSYETGLITKAPGSLRYNTQVLPAGIVAAHDFWSDISNQRLIAACSNGSIYIDIGDRVFGSAVAVKTGLSGLDPRSMFIEGGNETAGRNKKLFFFSPNNQVQVLSGNGSTFAEIADPAADWATPNYPTFGFIHRNRLWAFAKQIAYASDTGDHEDFDTNFLTQNVFPGEGGNLVGGFVFRGRAFVFKEGGFVYYLDDSDADSDNWFWRKLAANFGLASPHSVVQIANDMVAVNESGSPISYSAVDALGDIESADIFRILQIENYVRENTSLAGIEMMHSLYYEEKKQAFFTWRKSYNTKNDTLIHIDMNKQQPRVAFWPKDQVNCFAFRRGMDKVRRPIYGSDDGYIYLMDREDRLVGGSGYTGEFKIGHTDFRFLDERIAHKNKLFDYLAVEFKPQGTWNLEVDVYIDGSFSETISFSMDVRDDGLDSFTLDTDALGREETQTIQKPLHGSGRRISFHCRGTGANQNFAIASFTIGFRASAEQATRV